MGTGTTVSRLGAGVTGAPARGASVGAAKGASVGATRGASVGASVGASELSTGIGLAITGGPESSRLG